MQVAYEALRQRYPEEYVMYNLAAAALAHVLPRLRAALAAWQPLQQPTAWAAEFAAWRPLLEDPNTRGAIFQDAADAADPYYTLVSAAVLPRLQQAISTGWQVRGDTQKQEQSLRCSLRPPADRCWCQHQQIWAAAPCAKVRSGQPVQAAQPQGLQ